MDWRFPHDSLLVTHHLRRLVIATSLLALTAGGAEAGELRSADIVRYIRAAVQMRYQVPARDISVVWNDGDPAAKVGSLLDGNKVTYRIQENVLGSLAGRETVPLTFYNGDRLVRTVYFRVRVDAYKNVVVATVPIRARDRLTAHNTRLGRVPVNRVPAGALTTTRSLANSHARRALSVNAVITDQAVDAAPTVYAGAPVTLQVVNGGLTISTDGIVLSDGFAGQTVRVQNTANGQTVYATVVDARRVRITMEGDNE